MVAYVIVEINRGDPYQHQTEVLSVWLDEDGAKAEVKRLEDDYKERDYLYIEEAEREGRSTLYEAIEFDVMGEKKAGE